MLNKHLIFLCFKILGYVVAQMPFWIQWNHIPIILWVYLNKVSNFVTSWLCSFKNTNIGLVLKDILELQWVFVLMTLNLVILSFSYSKRKTPRQIYEEILSIQTPSMKRKLGCILHLELAKTLEKQTCNCTCSSKYSVNMQYSIRYVYK